MEKKNPRLEKLKLYYSSFLQGRDPKKTFTKLSIVYSILFITAFSCYKLYQFNIPRFVELETRKLLREDVQSIQVEEIEREE